MYNINNFFKAPLLSSEGSPEVWGVLARDGSRTCGRCGAGRGGRGRGRGCSRTGAGAGRSAAARASTRGGGTPGRGWSSARGRGWGSARGRGAGRGPPRRTRAGSCALGAGAGAGPGRWGGHRPHTGRQPAHKHLDQSVQNKCSLPLNIRLIIYFPKNIYN